MSPARCLGLAGLALAVLALPARGGDEPPPDPVKLFADETLAAIQLLSREHVKAVEPDELLRWAVACLYEQLREPLPAEIADRLKPGPARTRADRLAILTDVRARLGNRREFADGGDVDRALAAIFRRLEPGSDPRELILRQPVGCVLYIGTRGIPTGIGVTLATDSGKTAVEVVTVARDGPANRAGLRTGDRILHVTDLPGPEPLAIPDEGGFIIWGVRPENPWHRELRIRPHPAVGVFTAGLSVEKANELIEGKEGTKVRLTVRRAGETAQQNIDIERGPSRWETVFGWSRKADDSCNYLIDPAHRIVYLRLKMLGPRTEEDTAAALQSLTEGGVRGLVLDLRGCPGGLISVAAEVAARFIADGRILTIRPRGQPEVRFDGKREGSYLGFPMVCLIDRDTASAAEVIPACLQDYRRAVLIGERTPGTTRTQAIMRAGHSDLTLRFTNAVFIRPSGKNLARMMTNGRPEEDWGVVPDVKKELTDAERREVADSFRRQEAITRRGPNDAPVTPAAPDPQLELALRHLRGQLDR
jgi:carboxyl-terminal processing protease